MAQKRILIIEDDKTICDLVSMHLLDQGIRADAAADGKSGLAKALAEAYDLIILDIMLPEIDGFDVCKAIRAEKNRTPVLMLTSRSEEFDRVLGLELGADDYLTKPFSIQELIARVKAILRRSEMAATVEVPGSSPTIIRAELTIDMEKRKVLLAGKAIDLTAKEYDLLALFARNPGKAYSRHDLLVQVWGYQFDGYDHTVNSHINRLRAKIESDPANPRFIRTVWGHGYRFAEDEELSS